MRWSCTDGGGTSDPIPTTLLAFPPASLVQAVGTELAARMAAAPGPPGSEVAEGGGLGDKACTYPLPLCQIGVGEVHAVEGGNSLLRIYCSRPQPIHERCHPLGDTHCVVLHVHHVPRGQR